MFIPQPPEPHLLGEQVGTLPSQDGRLDDPPFEKTEKTFEEELLPHLGHTTFSSDRCNCSKR